MTIGTQPIRWGVSRIWNPTDFLNERQKDPLAIFDDRPGLSCIKLHVPFETSNTNLYLIVRPGLEPQLSRVRYAARIEQLIGTSEWTVSTDLEYDRPIKIGGDLSWGLGPVDLRAEIATRSRSETRLWTGASILSLPFSHCSEA